MWQRFVDWIYPAGRLMYAECCICHEWSIKAQMIHDVDGDYMHEPCGDIKNEYLAL